MSQSHEGNSVDTVDQSLFEIDSIFLKFSQNFLSNAGLKMFSYTQSFEKLFADQSEIRALPSGRWSQSNKVALMFHMFYSGSYLSIAFILTLKIL